MTTTSSDRDAQSLARIRELNDRLRTCRHPDLSPTINGSIIFTCALVERGEAFVHHAFAAVSNLSNFTSDNDPWGEHDMALLDVNGVSIFFKIDYYDVELTHHSPDPSDAGLTRRILTIGLAEDY